MAKLECLYKNRCVLSELLVAYLLGVQKMEGKYLGTTWTAILAVIFHPGSPQVNLGWEDFRENTGERSGEREA